MQASIRGGTSETEQTAVAVNPRGSPCRSRVVTTVTPVARRPMALRNPFASRVIGALSAGSYAQSLVCQPVAKNIYVLARNRKFCSLHSWPPLLNPAFVIPRIPDLFLKRLHPGQDVGHSFIWKRGLSC